MGKIFCHFDVKNLIRGEVVWGGGRLQWIGEAPLCSCPYHIHSFFFSSPLSILSSLFVLFSFLVSLLASLFSLLSSQGSFGFAVTNRPSLAPSSLLCTLVRLTRSPSASSYLQVPPPQLPSVTHVRQLLPGDHNCLQLPLGCLYRVLLMSQHVVSMIAFLSVFSNR